MLKAMGVSYTMQMYPHEQISGGLVTSQEVLPARGEAASTGKQAWFCCWLHAVAVVLAPHLSHAQLVHGSRPGLVCPFLTVCEGHVLPG